MTVRNVYVLWFLKTNRVFLAKGFVDYSSSSVILGEGEMRTEKSEEWGEKVMKWKS